MRISGYLLPILLGCTALSAPSASFAQVSVEATITLAPPALPDYAQPPIPFAGYVWTPGWWQYGPAGYYWVPGTWVQPPAVGLLWTPGYWAWNNGRYYWNAPYWGTQVGYYGGINYGYGYGGTGYAGGRWNRGQFEYNRAVNNFGTTRISNAYSQSVVNSTPFNHVSFNGGSGGVRSQPTVQQLAVAHEQHTPLMAVQTQHIQAAAANRALWASENQGRPAIAATSRPAEFSGQGIVASRGTAAPGAVQQQRVMGAPGPAIVARPGQPALGPATTSGAVQEPRATGVPGGVAGRAAEGRPVGVAQPALREPVTGARPAEPSQALRVAPANERPVAPVARAPAEGRLPVGAAQPAQREPATGAVRPAEPPQALRAAPPNERAVAPMARPAVAPEAHVAPAPQARAVVAAPPAPQVHEVARAPEVHAAAPAPQGRAAPVAGRDEKPPG